MDFLRTMFLCLIIWLTSSVAQGALRFEGASQEITETGYYQLAWVSDEPGDVVVQVSDD